MKYNELQQLAIDSTAPKVLVTAPAGSGKTSTLVGAIQKYAEENPFDRIVAITFTKKAALELQSRTFGLKVDSSTIHSWSLKELNRLGVKHKFKVSILQDDQIQEILQVLSRKCGYYSMNFYLLFAYVMGNYNIDVAQSTKMKYEKVLKTYIQYKRENHLYDFTDLPLYLFDMLNKYDEEIETIDALFVDEFQDVDDVQAQIFTKVKAKKYFYIGDEQQSIYIFRGAGPQNLKNLVDFERHTLKINYRSYQGIIDYANTMRDGGMISDTIRTQPCDIECARTDEDGEVYVINEYEECYDAVHGRMVSLMSTLTAFLLKKPYILCRSNKQVKAIESLGYRNVSTIHQAKGLEYTNVIVTDMELNSDEEINIAYVACTRAQNGLLICDPDLLYTLMNEILFEYRDEICGGKLF